jgi:predicted choloylglycine hydrolase
MVATRRLVCIVSLAVMLGPPVCTAEPYRFPVGKNGTKGELKYINDMPVLIVSGTPEEMGAAHGTLALKTAPKVIDYPRGLLKLFNAESLYGVFVHTGTTMYNRFPAEYRKELDAIAQSSGIEKDKLIVGNTLFDIKKILACSSILVEPERSATGGPLLGRNLDYPSLGYIQDYTLVTIYRPAGKHAFASVGFPGLLGCLSGMNDAGLSVAILEVMELKEGEPHFDPEGTPYALCYRKLLEDCTTIEEAKRALTAMHRTTTTNLVVADKKGVAIFEVSPKKVVQRPAVGGVGACTNHYCTEELRPTKTTDVAYTLERLKVLEKARDRTEKLDIGDVRKYLDDACLPEFTLQSMVFEPATLKLHLAYGAVPASRAKMRTLELAPLFKSQ